MEYVEKTLPFLPSPLRAIVQLLLYTAARPSEILNLQRGDIDTNGEVWTAIIRDHKTAYKGKERRLFFGPRAQSVLRPFLLRPDSEYLFSPQEAEAERHAKCPTHRRPTQRRNEKKTNRIIGVFYEHTGLNRAISRICKQHGIPVWTPYQLRHLAATTIEATADLQTASAILGHSGLNITQVYVHRDNKTAAAWAALHG
jgi:integrase